MKQVDEIDVLRKVIDLLTPLEADARQWVFDSARRKLGVDRASFSSQGPEAAQRNPTEPLPQGKPKAAQQYLRDYNYKVMTKRIAVVAVYLEREKGMKRFSFKDITEAFRNAKESKIPAQSQYARSVIMGYLGKEGDQFYATTKAEGLVDAYNQNKTDEADD